MIRPAEGFPRHVRQPYPWGCQVYSFYALTGDHRVLEIEHECSSIRFNRHTHQLGYYVMPVFTDILYNRWASAEWWREYAARIEEGTAPLLLTIKSPVAGVGYHSVAVLLGSDRVEVFDPSAAAMKRFALEQFLTTSYARAYAVDYVGEWKAMLEVHPSAFGPDQPHVSAEVREQFYASLKCQRSQCFPGDWNGACADGNPTFRTCPHYKAAQ